MPRFLAISSAGLALALAALLLMGGVSSGQGNAAPKRRALLVGINDYAHPNLRQPTPLKYAVNDVTDLAVVLKQSGYEVVELSDATGRSDAKLAPTKTNIEREMAAMSGRCQRGDTFLVALAGHGLQFEKEAYFCPSDGRPFVGNVDSLVSISKLYGELESSFAGTKLVLMDACRDDPTPGRGRSGIDADGAPPPQGVGVLFSCNRGQRAYEHDDLKHGVFFHYILEGLKGDAQDARGSVTFEGLSLYVRQNVPGRVQQFFPGVEQIPNLKADLSGIPILIDQVAGAIAKGPQPGDILTNNLGMKFAYCPPTGPEGFLMGSPATEKNRGTDETQHKVILTQGFYLGIHEVTVGQFRQFVTAENFRTEAERDGKGGAKWTGTEWKYDPATTWRNPGFTQTDQHPVVVVSWNDAVAYCAWLSRQDGMTYRLPTEAEWEYACRAGSTSMYQHGNDPEGLAHVGNVADASAKRQFNWTGTIAADDGYVYTAPVGRYRANTWGLHDLHGNVVEWCSDSYGDYPAGTVTNPTGPSQGALSRVYRGGTWDNSPWYCRSANRDKDSPEIRDYDLGFRVLLVQSSR